MKRAVLILPLLATLSTAQVFAENVSADDPVTDTTTFQVSITGFLTLTVDQTDNIAHLSPSTRFNTGSIVASVATNNAAGYTLTFEDADDRNGLERSGYSSASVEDKPLYNIPSVVSATTYANLTDDTYGYFLGSTTATEATYLPVPLTSTEIDSSDEPTAPASSTTINFGVKISATRPSGTYQDTVVISAVANMGNISFDDAYSAASKSRDNTSGKYKLHEMTPSICEAVTTDQTGELVDIRDGTVYHVGKLKDNRCWLLDNLALDPTQSAVKANMTDINTNASAAAITNYKEGGNISGYAGWATEAVSVETNTSIHNQPRVNAASKNVIPSDGLSTDGGWKVGIYYNYCAASIGTYCYDDESGVDTNTASAIDAEYDICPANWRMPTGGSNDDQSGYYTGLDGGEYQTLYDKYDDLATFRTFFHLPLSGSFTGGSSGYQGSSADIWSSTFKYSNAFYDLYTAASGNVSPQDGDTRDSGFSVRCIAKTGTESAPDPTPVDPDPNTTTFDEAYAAAGKSRDVTTGKYIMQDMTTSICNAVTTSIQADSSDTQETLLVDNRDNKLYWVAKMKDGHCWMTQNLDLDLEAEPTNVAPLTHANTDLGWTNNITSATWNPDYSTIAFDAATDAGLSGQDWSWDYNYYRPYSANPGAQYVVSSGTASDDAVYYTLADCKAHVPSGTEDECRHYHTGNYYSWTAAIARNDSDTYYLRTQYNVATDSICPAGWRMPVGKSSNTYSSAATEYAQLMYSQGIITNISDDSYATDGFINLRDAPLFFIRGGYVASRFLTNSGHLGFYWSSAIYDSDYAYNFEFSSSEIYPTSYYNRWFGWAVRCIAR